MVEGCHRQSSWQEKTSGMSRNLRLWLPIALVASRSKTYFYLKHRSGHGNQSEKAFSSPVTKAGGVKADAEVGAEEQQLSTALAVESKETGKKREHPVKGGDLGWGGEIKPCLLRKTLCPLTVCWVLRYPVKILVYVRCKYFIYSVKDLWAGIPLVLQRTLTWFQFQGRIITRIDF